MAVGSVPDGLKSYLPTSYFEADGTTLKSGVDAAQATKVAQGIQAKAGALPPAEAQLFLAMVHNADLAPNGQVPADLDKAIDSFAAAATVVASLSVSSNALNLLSRVMVEQAASQRKDALNERLAAREQAKSELMDQAGKMRDEADKLASGAMTAMIMTVVTSVISIVGGFVSVAGSAVSGFKGAKAAKEALAAGESAETAAAAFKNLGNSKALNVGRALAEGTGEVSKSIGGLGQGLSNYFSTDSQAQAKTLEAEGQESAARAQETQAKGDLSKEQQQALDQMVQSIIQFLKDMQEAKAQQMQALTRV